jgi:hypothetical protein
MEGKAHRVEDRILRLGNPLLEEERSGWRCNHVTEGIR